MYLLYGLSSNRKMGIHHNDGFMISIATQILTEITKDFCFKIQKTTPQNREYIGITMTKLLYMTFHFCMTAKTSVLSYTF